MESYIFITDKLSLKHMQGAKICDTHGGSAPVNAVSVFLKLYQLKLAEKRGQYSSAFQREFGNEYGSTRRNFNSEILRIAVGNIEDNRPHFCLLYTSPSPRDGLLSRMPSSA